MSVMLCQTPFVLSGIVFHLMSLLAPSTSDTGGNVYTRYYIEDSCLSDNEYNLDETGLASAAEFVTARDSSRYSHQQTNNSVITCRLKIVPPHRYGVLLTASRVSFQTTSDSCRSFIQIYEYNKPIKICWNRKLGKTSFTTVGNLTIVYHLNRMDFQNQNDDYNVEVSNAENFRAISGIKLTATAYHRVYPRCNEDQFQCRHIRCIWKGFACDDVNNCGDNTDERTYWPSNCRRTDPFTTMSTYDVTIIYTYNQHSKAITEVAIASALLIIVAVAFRFFCYYRCQSLRRSESMAGIGVVGEMQTPFQASAPSYTAVANENCRTSGEILFPPTAEPPSYSVAFAQAPPYSKEQKFSVSLRTTNNFSRNNNQPFVDNLTEPPPYHAIYDLPKQ